MRTRNQAKLRSRREREGDHETAVVEMVKSVEERLTSIEEIVTDMHQFLQHQAVEKEFYTTAEVAQAMQVSVYTVCARWCKQGRIACEKDRDTGKWRIPGSEFRRLVKGGAVKVKQSNI
jgi:hypothetical protein